MTYPFDKVKHVLTQIAATWWVKRYVSLTSIVGITSIYCEISTARAFYAKIQKKFVIL